MIREMIPTIGTALVLAAFVAALMVYYLQRRVKIKHDRFRFLLFFTLAFSVMALAAYAIKRFIDTESTDGRSTSAAATPVAGKRVRGISAGAFQVVTSPTTTSLGMTVLNHPQLNGNPNAMVFLHPVWEELGDLNPNFSVGVRYQNGLWWICKQSGAPMPSSATERYRYNVLFYARATPNVFLHTATPANRMANGTTLDHPQLNTNPDAVLLVTQRFGASNAHEVGVQYGANRWHIFNLDGTTLPVSAQFNVLQLSNGTAPGLTGAFSFNHVQGPANRLTTPEWPGYSAIDQPRLNNQASFRLFLTQRLVRQRNPYVVNVWFDRPDDDYQEHRNGYWLVYNPETQATMPIGVFFNGLAVPK